MKKLPLFRILMALAICLILALSALAEEDTFSRQFDASLTDYYDDLNFATTDEWRSTAWSRAMFAACILTDGNQLEDVDWDCPVALTWEMGYPELIYIDTAQNLCELAYFSGEIWNGVFYMAPVSSIDGLSAPTKSAFTAWIGDWYAQDKYAFVTREDFSDALDAIGAAFESDSDIEFDDDSGSSNSGGGGDSSYSSYEPYKLETKCYKCHGSGSVTCSQCNGSGSETRYVSSPNFSGSSWSNSASTSVRCGKCHGSGSVTCPACHGSGVN